MAKELLAARSEAIVVAIKAYRSLVLRVLDWCMVVLPVVGTRVFRVLSKAHQGAEIELKNLISAIDDVNGWSERHSKSE